MTTLGVEGRRFTIDGTPTFLLGISYYGGLGAEEALVAQDIAEMKRLGFNWLRVWATWTGFDHDISAVEDDGRPREPYRTRLKRLVEIADEHGMIVDVTLTRGGRYNTSEARLWGKLPDLQSHMTAIETVTEALLPYRNVYIDLANERNIEDTRFVPFEDLAALRERVRELDPERLVTASHAGDIQDDEMLRAYLSTANVDLLTPHRPRHGGSPGQTLERSRAYLAAMERLGRVVPLHYQEPFRRDFNPKRWNPRAEDFLTDLVNARRGGAAGWCFHNGDTRGGPEDMRPRRSFDLRDGSVFDQLDEEERAFLAAMRRALDTNGEEP